MSTLYYLVQSNPNIIFELGKGLHNENLLIQRTKESLYNHLLSEITNGFFSVLNREEWAREIAEVIWTHFQLGQCKIISDNDFELETYDDYTIVGTIYDDKKDVGKSIREFCRKKSPFEQFKPNVNTNKPTLRVGSDHSYNPEHYKLLEPYLDKPIDLITLASLPVPVSIGKLEDNELYIDHPYCW